MGRLAVFAGLARTTPANDLLVAGLRRGAADRRDEAACPLLGCDRLSADLFRQEGWRGAGFESLDDLLERLFEQDYGRFADADLLCQLAKWRLADVSRHTGGDLSAALGRISARTVVAAFSHDGWFPLADCEAEQRLVSNSELRVVESLWGHYAWGMTQAETDQIETVLRDLLAT